MFCPALFNNLPVYISHLSLLMGVRALTCHGTAGKMCGKVAQ